MATLRTRKRENPFVQIDKNIFVDSNISWKAKGILGYLLSKPDDWITYITDVEKQSTDGRDSVRTGVNELIDAGYMQRKSIRCDDGTFGGYEYLVSETPCGLPEVGKPEIGKSEVGETEVGKGNTTNNELTNNDFTNNELTKKDIPPYAEIINYLNNATGKKFKHTTRATQKEIKARWNQKFVLDDFKKVIDIKTEEWLKDNKMNKYLRPETLFGNKFESYLNQTNDIVPDDDGYDYGF